MFARVVRQIRTLQHKAHPVCAMPGLWQEMRDNVYQKRVQRMNIHMLWDYLLAIVPEIDNVRVCICMSF